MWMRMLLATVRLDGQPVQRMADDGGATGIGFFALAGGIIIAMLLLSEKLSKSR